MLLLANLALHHLRTGMIELKKPLSTTLGQGTALVGTRSDQDMKAGAEQDHTHALTLLSIRSCLLDHSILGETWLWSRDMDPTLRRNTTGTTKMACGSGYAKSEPGARPTSERSRSRYI